ncbi:MAG TPA: hypothetical protein O0X14_02990, partial [Methanocorpusculum sp.]|nr:hypothetical protein [Methanocorpusculum sp.]
CKMYLSETGVTYLPWIDSETYLKYKQYSQSRKSPCIVIIGLHGFADDPKFLFALPLREATPDIPKDILQKYEISDDNVDLLGRL